MSAPRKSINVTKEESRELLDLFRQVDTSLTSTSVEELERFSDLFVKSLLGKGDQTPSQE